MNSRIPLVVLAICVAAMLVACAGPRPEPAVVTVVVTATSQPRRHAHLPGMRGHRHEDQHLDITRQIRRRRERPPQHSSSCP